LENPQTKSRKKKGIKASFEELVAKLISYIEVMGIYLQKNLQVYLRNLVISSVWIFSAVFFIFFSLGYLSFGVFLSLQKYVFNNDPIFASFGTAFLFLALAIFFIELVLKKK